jgi:hypothetical protein
MTKRFHLRLDHALVNSPIQNGHVQAHPVQTERNEIYDCVDRYGWLESFFLNSDPQKFRDFTAVALVSLNPIFVLAAFVTGIQIIFHYGRKQGMIGQKLPFQNIQQTFDPVSGRLR